jgi:rod shape-determining protein MreC
MNAKSRIAVFGLVGILVALAALQTPLLHPARGFLWNMWVSSLGRFFSVGPLEIDNNTLTQMHQLQSENIRLQGELRDYAKLRQEIGQNSFESFRAIPAAIDARPLDTFHSQYILNRGVRDGVGMGAPVVVWGSTLIGFISDVHDRSSVVQLVTHPGTAFTAATVPKDEGQDAARGLVEGRLFTGIALTTVPRDLPLSENEPVVTVAKENTIPAGLVVGKVSHVKNDPNEAYQEADVVYDYDVDRLSAVTILVSK